MVTPKLAEEQPDRLAEWSPDHEPSSEGGTLPADKREMIQGSLWILDNCAKRKDLATRFGSTSTVHRSFQSGTPPGVVEGVMRGTGPCIEKRNGYRLYGCCVDGTFAKDKGGGDGIGKTKAGKGVKIMVLAHARGVPGAIDTASASPHERKLLQHLFAFMLTDETPERVMGDKAYGRDQLADELADQDIELMAPPLARHR